MLRVYVATIGVESRSTLSRKNVRFSGYDSAKRLLTSICGTSASICEKSGLSVPSMVRPRARIPLQVETEVVLEIARRLAARVCAAVVYGAIVKWLPVGNPSSPATSDAWQRKHPEFFGMGVLAMM